MTILEIYKRHNNGWQTLVRQQVNNLDEWQQVINECCKKFNVNDNDLLITPYITPKEEQKAN